MQDAQKVCEGDKHMAGGRGLGRRLTGQNPKDHGSNGPPSSFSLDQRFGRPAAGRMEGRF